MKKSGLADSPLFVSPQTKRSSTPPTARSIIPESKKPEGKIGQRTDVRTIERKSVRTNVRKKKRRVRIRHAFDIYEDQLRALHTLQLEAIRAGKIKPRLGKMVQKALDQYLENMKIIKV
jgi:hypothetical protein